MAFWLAGMHVRPPKFCSHQTHRGTAGTKLHRVETLRTVKVRCATQGELHNLYEVLGVPPNATERDIKAAFRRRALESHPDISKEIGAEVKFIQVRNAYDVLSCAARRKAYDRELQRLWSQQRVTRRPYAAQQPRPPESHHARGPQVHSSRAYSTATYSTPHRSTSSSSGNHQSYSTHSTHSSHSTHSTHSMHSTHSTHSSTRMRSSFTPNRGAPPAGKSSRAAHTTYHDSAGTGTATGGGSYSAFRHNQGTSSSSNSSSFASQQNSNSNSRSNMSDNSNSSDSRSPHSGGSSNHSFNDSSSSSSSSSSHNSTSNQPGFNFNIHTSSYRSDTTATSFGSHGNSTSSTTYSYNSSMSGNGRQGGSNGTNSAQSSSSRSNSTSFFSGHSGANSGSSTFGAAHSSARGHGKNNGANNSADKNGATNDKADEMSGSTQFASARSNGTSNSASFSGSHSSAGNGTNSFGAGTGKSNDHSSHTNKSFAGTHSGGSSYSTSSAPAEGGSMHSKDDASGGSWKWFEQVLGWAPFFQQQHSMQHEEEWTDAGWNVREDPLDNPPLNSEGANPHTFASGSTETSSSRNADHTVWINSRAELQARLTVWEAMMASEMEAWHKEVQKTTTSMQASLKEFDSKMQERMEKSDKDMSDLQQTLLQQLGTLDEQLQLHESTGRAKGDAARHAKWYLRMQEWTQTLSGWIGAHRTSLETWCTAMADLAAAGDKQLDQQSADMYHTARRLEQLIDDWDASFECADPQLAELWESSVERWREGIEDAMSGWFLQAGEYGRAYSRRLETCQSYTQSWCRQAHSAKTQWQARLRMWNLKLVAVPAASSRV